MFYSKEILFKLLIEKFGKFLDFSKSEINRNRSIKTIVTCKQHGDFQINLFELLGRKHGCRKCANIKNVSYNNKIEKFKNIFIDRAKTHHNNKYDYSLVEYIKSDIPVTIICPLHGEFQQPPVDHLQNKGCKKCGLEEMATYHRMEKADFISNSLKIHGKKYDYSAIEYKNCRTHVEIICKQHGSFFQKPRSHLEGHGCPKCRESKGERKIRVWLESNNIEYEYQKMFHNCRSPKNRIMPFDFFLPAYNMCIEFDGELHFCHGIINGHAFGEQDLKKAQQHDMIKNSFCKQNNIKLLRIKYTKIKRIEKILTETLLD
jgi:hypothetical protein